MSLIDQFEVQFNELSNGEILEGSLDEIQPVELAGVLQQEINRIQSTVSPSEKVEEINISLSNHDYKRLKKYESLIVDGLETILNKTSTTVKCKLSYKDGELTGEKIKWTNKK